MTKADIVKLLADQVGLTRREAADALAVVLDGVIEAIRTARRSSCAVSARSAPASGRRGRAATPAPARRSRCRRRWCPYFKPGKQLREILGGK